MIYLFNYLLFDSLDKSENHAVALIVSPVYNKNRQISICSVIRLIYEINNFIYEFMNKHSRKSFQNESISDHFIPTVSNSRF